MIYRGPERRRSSEDHDLLIQIHSNLNNHIQNFREHRENFEKHIKDDKENFEKQEKRIKSLERAYWIAVGGFAAIKIFIKAFKL